MIILEIVLILIIVGLAFLYFNPVFGARVTKEDKINYQKRANNYVNGKFIYPKEYEMKGEDEDNRVSNKGKTPKTKLPVEKPIIECGVGKDEVTVTWFGHSTVLVQMQGMNILFDPVFSKYASPFSFIGPKRFSEQPMEIDNMPKIDIVIITHNHYDHLDMKAIKTLDNKVGKYIVPLGIKSDLKRWNVEEEKIEEMAWWEESIINGLTIGCTPAKHFSSRHVFDRESTLYASWVLKNKNHQIFESGDGGFGGHFEEIHKRYGDFDLVLMENGQYNMMWHDIHMFPEEAALGAKILGAKISMPIHWGAYVLSNHAWDDSMERFVLASEREGIEVITPKLGETVRIDKYEEYMKRWWKDIY